MSMKDPLAPAGIEPANFRFVAQHLNHCATANKVIYLTKFMVEYGRTMCVLCRFIVLGQYLIKESQ